MGADYGNKLVTPTYVTSLPDSGAEFMAGDEAGAGDVVNRVGKANFAMLQALASGAIGLSLLKNGSMESWSLGTAVAPDQFVLSGGGSVARSTTKKRGTYAAEVTYSGSDTFLYQDYPDYVYFQSGKVTVGAWVKSSTASIARIKIDDGVGTAFSDYHTGGGSYELLTVTITLDGSASQLRTELHVEGAGNAIFDAVKLEEGEIVTAFSHHPGDQHLKAINYEDSTDTAFIYNNIMMQVGNAAFTANKALTITYPVAFTKILGVLALWETGGGDPVDASGANLGYDSLGTTSVIIRASANNSRGCTWVVIGVE